MIGISMRGKKDSSGALGSILYRCPVLSDEGKGAVSSSANQSSQGGLRPKKEMLG